MNKIKQLRKLMKIHNIDGYIVPKNDEYFGEYIDKSKERLKFVSSFSGSAGIGLIFKKKCYIFVDGRYTIQAKKEVNKPFKVVEIHKTKPKKVLNSFKKKITIGFDPRLHTELNLKNLYKLKKITLKPIGYNLIDKIWKNKPNLKNKKFYLLKLKEVGTSHKTKINKVIQKIKKYKADKILITASENIAWLLNIRGHDSDFSPIPNCNLILDKNGNMDLIVPKSKIDLKFLKFFGKKLNIVTPEKFHSHINKYDSKNKIVIDSLTCSFFYRKILLNKFKLIEKIDPIYLFKSIKNKKEIDNIKKIHILDGAALTKFIIWVKNNYLKKNITELSAANKLESFRKFFKDYKFPSFNTISATGSNGAIIHYKPTSKSNKRLQKGDLYLVDSGGQYHYGTTDVTRTIPLGNQNEKIKEIFTKVLKCHIAVVNYKLKKNTTGSIIDKVARRPLLKMGLNYQHGTGHGVGYFLNVHEGPQAISYGNKINIKKGMIISNEPGYYLENKFGIRIENLIYVSTFGQNLLRFKNLTYAPIDPEMVKIDFLNNEERKYIKNYNFKTLKKINPFLNYKEKSWYKENFLF
ncbi:MAG: Xaa-Pro aminopeptidase [Candidatus Pelagibacter sp. TMED64]|nr:Xaa-Pro aminopeptidase [Candidatus Pelagibacter sp.]OUU67906.1 MAG: Xaa-Pro aminopeptidase [Candidatus Pelagibacter sp. TMED64]|tara:strand:- start:10592 stop:12322 length:1731 start_codon:yes stop_codon:yes gene_type:complete